MSESVLEPPKAGLPATAPAHRRRHSANFRGGFVAAGVTAILLTSLAAVSCLRLGSVSAGFAYLAGERLIIDSRVKRVRHLVPGQETTVAFNVTNLTGQPVTVVGASGSCTCARVENLPVTIAHAMSRQLIVRIRGTDKESRELATVRFYTDLKGKPELPVVLVGSTK